MRKTTTTKRCGQRSPSRSQAERGAHHRHVHRHMWIEIQALEEKCIETFGFSCRPSLCNNPSAHHNKVNTHIQIIPIPSAAGLTGLLQGLGRRPLDAALHE